MNSMDMLKGLVKSGGSPEKLAKQMINSQFQSNPIINNLIEMAQKGDEKSVENFARNMCKEKGTDFDKEFSNFMSQFK